VWAPVFWRLLLILSFLGWFGPEKGRKNRGEKERKI
jgi:hypothetical protein